MHSESAPPERGLDLFHKLSEDSLELAHQGKDERRKRQTHLTADRTQLVRYVPSCG